MYKTRCNTGFVHKNRIIPTGIIMDLDRGGRLVGSRGGTMPGPIALKLRDLRVERGLTQKQAAELARVTPQTLIDLESGKRPPYMPTLTKIARAYGVSLEELVEEE